MKSERLIRSLYFLGGLLAGVEVAGQGALRAYLVILATYALLLTIAMSWDRWHDA